MLWLGVLCTALAALAAALAGKVLAMRQAARELRLGLAQRREQDTNTLLTVSCRDGEMRRLADALNGELRQLREKRRRFQSGDRELKEAVTNISHDLRTPLTAICGYLELLEREKHPPETARYLALIANRVQALKQLTEELFRYSLITSTAGRLHREPVALDRLLEDSLAAQYAAFSKRGIVPVVELPGTAVVRRLDCAAMRRVLENVLANALKYSEGDLTVRLSVAGELTFANTARGLDKVQVEQLFDRFYTVETARNSTGLGLAISKALVEEMHGHMSASYQASQLTIAISFPQEDETAARDGAPPVV